MAVVCVLTKLDVAMLSCGDKNKICSVSKKTTLMHITCSNKSPISHYVLNGIAHLILVKKRAISQRSELFESRYLAGINASLVRWFSILMDETAWIWCLAQHLVHH